MVPEGCLIKGMPTPNVECNLGAMFFNGQGSKQDVGEAARLFCKVTEQGQEGAKKRVLLEKEEVRKERQAAPASQPSLIAHICQLRRRGGGGRQHPEAAFAVQDRGVLREGVPDAALEGQRPQGRVQVVKLLFRPSGRSWSASAAL